MLADQRLAEIMGRLEKLFSGPRENWRIAPPGRRFIC
jgi:hypothetical protein